MSHEPLSLGTSHMPTESLRLPCRAPITTPADLKAIVVRAIFAKLR